LIAIKNITIEKYRFNSLAGSLFANFAPMGAVKILHIVMPHKVGK
jgi:hypothetical protein